MQRFEGRSRGGFTNLDPEIYSGVAMVTLDLPLNSAKNTAFYLMGGGGAYQFRNIGVSSSLTGNFPGIDESSKSEVKWGLTGGAGLEVHVIGASSLYLQTAFTNVSAGGRNLNWVPVNIGVMLR
jgi:opacity protein-like surface antigen